MQATDALMAANDSIFLVLSSQLDSIGAITEEARSKSDTLTVDTMKISQFALVIDSIKYVSEELMLIKQKIIEHQNDSLFVLIQDLEALDTSEVYMSNQKTVLKALFENSMMDSVQTSTKDALLEFADISLDSLGPVVSQARAMLGPCEGYFVNVRKSPNEPSNLATQDGLRLEKSTEVVEKLTEGSLDHLEPEIEMYIQGNPVTSKLNIQWSQAVSGELSIVSITGVMVYWREVEVVNNFSVDMSFLSSGMYFVTFISSDSPKCVQTRKIQFVK